MRNRSSLRPEKKLMTSPPNANQGNTKVDGGALYFVGHGPAIWPCEAR